MRFFVQSGAKNYVIPCKDGKASVAALKREVLARCMAVVAKSEAAAASAQEARYDLILKSSGAVLCDQDIVEDVLQDGDTLSLQAQDELHQAPAASNGMDLSTLPSYSLEVCNQLSLENIEKCQHLELDGNSLTIDKLIKIGKGEYHIKLSDTAVEAITKSRKVIDDIVDDHRVVYGVTTGFGKFANVVISNTKLVELQESLIRSHAVGVGSPLSPEQTRCLLTLRVNVLAKGFSGVRLETVQKLVDALNASCLPFIPDKGTVGASGDLAPLSHLALGMMGEGSMWCPKSGWGQASDILHAHQLKPITLQAKEGLSLINGTQFITAIGAEAHHRADIISQQADIIAALTIDVLMGTPMAFDHDIHANRPHPGQQVVAGRLRALLDSNVYPSQLRESHKNCSRVQDPYTMRCVPQVHGIVNDTIKFVGGVLTTEMNSALDNPMVLAERQLTISGGNFHGEYPAKVLDYLSIGIHELANMSERRIERLVNPAYSNLPAFLVQEGGLNSGFMIAHCTAAALVSENKVLTHPSSVDSITTSAGQEDHVSMGGFAARKALEVVQHVEQVLAIELLAACQALEFHRPKKTTAPLEEVYKLVRTVAKPWDKDRYFAPDVNAVTSLLTQGKVWEVVAPFLKKYEAECFHDNAPNSSSPYKHQDYKLGVAPKIIN